MHNWIKKLNEMIELGETPDLKSGEFWHVEVAHDDDCELWNDGECDCDPDITFARKWTQKEEER